MPEGFYKESSLALVKSPTSLLPQCGKCRLYEACRTPKMPLYGSGRKGILVVGEAPGRGEDIEGVPFVGESGKILKRALTRAGVDLYKDCWVTNSLICHPGSAIPDPKMVEWCRPNLLQNIEDAKPSVILLLGKSAVRSLVGHVWRADPEGIKRWAGWRIPCRKPNAWICPTYHPSFVLRGKRDQSLYEMVFEGHVRAAVENLDRPWDTIPDYEKRVEVILDSDRAAKVVRKMIERGGVVAYDYETNMLKPDSDKARIVSCSVCWEGKKTIAYPWMGEAVKATGEMLQSGLGKIASNAKFEDRWSRKFFGVAVKNWKWDTMLQAHALDCRPGITSIKFQAFVHLGQPDYDGHIKPYLQSKEKGGNAENRIREVDIRSLLTYNALDSLLEYEVAMIQMRKLGVR